MKFTHLTGLDNIEIDKTQEQWPDACGNTQESAEALNTLLLKTLEEVIEEKQNSDNDRMSSIPSIIAVLSQVTPEQLLLLAGIAVQSILQEQINHLVSRSKAQMAIEQLLNKLERDERSAKA